MVGWHHRLDGHESEQAPGAGDGQGDQACCSPWGCKASDTTEGLSNHNCDFTVYWAPDEKPRLRAVTALPQMIHLVVTRLSLRPGGPRFSALPGAPRRAQHVPPGGTWTAPSVPDVPGCQGFPPGSQIGADSLQREQGLPSGHWRTRHDQSGEGRQPDLGSARSHGESQERGAR